MNQDDLERQALIERLQALSTHTRDSVRKEIHEGDYIRLFGTFSSFKLAAGLSPTRLEKQFNSQLAESVGNYELNKLNDKKREYEGKYLKPSSDRFQTVITGSDIHSKISDEFTVNCFVDTIRRVQPDVVCLAGDIVDFECLSSHGGNDHRRFTISDEMEWLDQFLLDVREAAPNAQITYVCGNHENRLLRHFANESPFVKELLCDYHGFNFAKLLGLDKYEINFVSKDDLTVYKESAIRHEVSKNYIMLNDTLVIGHEPAIKKLKMPSLHGHIHQYVVQNNYSLTHGAFQHVQLGAMCKLDSTYCCAAHWDNGFMISHLDTNKKGIQHEYINTSNDFVMIGGKFMER